MRMQGRTFRMVTRALAQAHIGHKVFCLSKNVNGAFFAFSKACEVCHACGVNIKASGVDRKIEFTESKGVIRFHASTDKNLFVKNDSTRVECDA